MVGVESRETGTGGRLYLRLADEWLTGADAKHSQSWSESWSSRADSCLLSRPTTTAAAVPAPSWATRPSSVPRALLFALCFFLSLFHLFQPVYTCSISYTPACRPRALKDGYSNPSPTVRLPVVLFLAEKGSHHAPPYRHPSACTQRCSRV